MKTIEGVYVPAPERPSRAGLGLAVLLWGIALAAGAAGFFLAPVVVRALFGG